MKDSLHQIHRLDKIKKHYILCGDLTSKILEGKLDETAAWQFSLD